MIAVYVANLKATKADKKADLRYEKSLKRRAPKVIPIYPIFMRKLLNKDALSMGDITMGIFPHYGEAWRTHIHVPHPFDFPQLEYTMSFVQLVGVMKAATTVGLELIPILLRFTTPNRVGSNKMFNFT